MSCRLVRLARPRDPPSPTDRSGEPDTIGLVSNNYEDMALDEDQLEPVELVRQSGVVARMGLLMLSAGTGSYRVKSAMKRVAAAMQLDHLEAQVTLTELTVTSFRGRIFRTEVAEVKNLGVNADRIARLEDLARDLPVGVSAKEVWRRLDEIEARKHLYPVIVNALGAALACAAFAFLNNGGWIECATVFFAAGLGQFIRATLLRQHLNQFMAAIIASAVSTLSYILVIGGLDAANLISGSHEAGYLSAVLFLIPGFPIITAALDMAKLDFSSGLSRIAYALMILMSAALAVWAVSAIVGLEPSVIPPLDLIEPARWSLRILTSFAGVFGFAIMFNSPVRMAIAAGVIGMLANCARLGAMDAGVQVQAATFGAAILVGVLAALIAPRLGLPRITLSVPAVLIFVPGSATYRAIVFLNNHQVTEAVQNGIDAVFIMVAIAIGLAVARMITDKDWAFDK